MILPAQHIRKFALEQKMIEPFTERGEIRGKTYGLGPATYDLRCAQRLKIGPKDFILASTIEKITLNSSIRATVCDKSSWARLGLAVQNTKIDPGFTGYITIELSNHGSLTLDIYEGDPICQLEFAYLAAPTELPYKGKYQNQGCGPVGPIDGKGAWE